MSFVFQPWQGSKSSGHWPRLCQMRALKEANERLYKSWIHLSVYLHLCIYRRLRDMETSLPTLLADRVNSMDAVSHSSAELWMWGGSQSECWQQLNYINDDYVWMQWEVSARKFHWIAVHGNGRRMTEYETTVPVRPTKYTPQIYFLSLHTESSGP